MGHSLENPARSGLLHWARDNKKGSLETALGRTQSSGTPEIKFQVLESLFF